MREMRSEIRRWVRRYEAVEHRIAIERRGGLLDPDALLGRALELGQLTQESDPAPSGDPTEEDLRVYAAWSRLRAAARGHP